MQLVAISASRCNPDPSPGPRPGSSPEQIGVWNWERFDSAEFGDLHKQGML